MIEKFLQGFTGELFNPKVLGGLAAIWVALVLINYFRATPEDAAARLEQAYPAPIRLSA